MNIIYNSPTPTKTLGDMTDGEVFRFPNCKAPCMKINYNGNEVFQAYHYYYDIDDALDECIVVHEHDFYTWIGEQEHLDYECYQQSEILDNLLAYVSLDTGKIYVSHIDERVIPLKADLIIDEMRSPD
jgi:hypothetical protein